MKKSITALFAVLLLVSCAKEMREGNLEINGNVKGLKKGMLYLKKYEDTAMVTLDSIRIDGDSRFQSFVTIAEPEMLYLFLDRGQTTSIDNSLMFFAEPGKMTIDTDLETFYAQAKIGGSENQKLYEEFKKVRSRYVNEELEFTKLGLEAFKNKTVLSDEQLAKADRIKARKYLYVVNFAINNKNREIAPFVTLSEIPDASVKYLEMIQKAMTPEIAKSKYGKLLTQYVAERKKAADTLASN